MGKGAGEDPELIGVLTSIIGWELSYAGCKRMGQDRQKWRQLVACTVEHDEPTRLYDDCHNTIITYDYSWLKYTRVSKSIETKMFS